jgi:hypothetical protein
MGPLHISYQVAENPKTDSRVGKALTESDEKSSGGGWEYPCGCSCACIDDYLCDLGHELGLYCTTVVAMSNTVRRLRNKLHEF